MIKNKEQTSLQRLICYLRDRRIYQLANSTNKPKRAPSPMRQAATATGLAMIPGVGMIALPIHLARGLWAGVSNIVDQAAAHGHLDALTPNAIVSVLLGEQADSPRLAAIQRVAQLSSARVIPFIGPLVLGWQAHGRATSLDDRVRQWIDDMRAKDLALNAAPLRRQTPPMRQPAELQPSPAVTQSWYNLMLNILRHTSVPSMAQLHYVDHLRRQWGVIGETHSMLALEDDLPLNLVAAAQGNRQRLQDHVVTLVKRGDLSAIKVDYLRAVARRLQWPVEPFIARFERPGNAIAA